MSQQSQQSKRAEQQQVALHEKLRKVLRLLEGSGASNGRAASQSARRATPGLKKASHPKVTAKGLSRLKTQAHSSAELAELLYSKAPFDFIDAHSGADLAALAQRAQQAVQHFLLRPASMVVEYEHSALFTRFYIVRPDCPFIVTSITEVLREFNIFMRAYLHPILPQGESYISLSLIEVPVLDEATSARIAKRIKTTLGDLSLVTSDFAEMRQIASEIGESSEETKSFIEWLSEGAFLFCGALEWSTSSKKCEVLRSLGLARSTQAFAKPLLAELREDLGKLMSRRQEMFAARLSIVSPIHRRARLFHIAVRVPARGASQSRVISLIGLMTSLARGLESSRLLIIRRKMEEIFSLRKILKNSYDYKHVIKLIDNMPLEDALRLSTAELTELVRRSLDVVSTDSTQVAVFYEALGRGVTVAIALPRDRFTSGLRGKLQAHVEQSFGVTPEVAPT
jgi:glutamate dehydrogenase